jgi:hypothetical protein
MPQWGAGSRYPYPPDGDYDACFVEKDEAHNQTRDKDPAPFSVFSLGFRLLNPGYENMVTGMEYNTRANAAGNTGLYQLNTQIGMILGRRLKNFSAKAWDQVDDYLPDPARNYPGLHVKVRVLTRSAQRKDGTGLAHYHTVSIVEAYADAAMSPAPAPEAGPPARAPAAARPAPDYEQPDDDDLFDDDETDNDGPDEPLTDDGEEVASKPASRAPRDIPAPPQRRRKR